VSGAASILVVEDDSALAGLLVEELTAEGWQVEACRSAEAAQGWLKSRRPDLVVTDLQLPGADGMTLLRGLLEDEDPPAVLMITAFGTVERAVDALKAGADDFLTKPLDIDHLLLSCRRVLEYRRLRHEARGYRELNRELAGHSGFHGMLGNSPAMRRLFDEIRRVARADGPVLVSGPSGSGKENVARALHAESRRAEAPFVAVNCAAVPADLMESEFFGHAAGAFTGAQGARAGLFRQAGGGTLFLDEIGEMPAGLQARLLRALQDGRIRPVGEEHEVSIDVRVIAASNRNLEELVERDEFRTDLYFRLETFRIHVPPLAERGEDVELLAQYFVLRHAAAADRPAREIGDAALRSLRAYGWPGNVRELSSAMERAVTFCNAEVIEPGHLPERVRRGARRPATQGGMPDELFDDELLPTLDELRARYVAWVLERTGGNKRRAAALLGIGRRTLYRWLDGASNAQSRNAQSRAQ